MSQSDQPESAKGDAPATEPPRRSFMYNATTLVISAIVGLSPFVAGLGVFFDPLRRRGKASGEETGNWLRIASIGAVPADGVPRQFPVIADQVDAWNRTPDQPVGLLYVRREPDSKTVQVFTAVCPHAGCFVGVVEKDEQKQYLCPCHNSAFGLDGEKIEVPGVSHPSPRGLDPLPVDQEKLDATGEIWVDFKSFYPGKHERVEKT